MICPWCEHNNLAGEEHCRNCALDLTQLDRPAPQDRVEQSLMADAVKLALHSAPLTLPPTATVGEAMEFMLDHNIGAVLVADGNNTLLGIFSERDLLMKVAGVCDGYAGRPISEFMTRRPETIGEGDSLAYALHKMDCGGYRHLPVLQDGRLVGALSVRDVVAHILAICKTISSSGG